MKNDKSFEINKEIFEQMTNEKIRHLLVTTIRSSEIALNAFVSEPLKTVAYLDWKFKEVLEANIHVDLNYIALLVYSSIGNNDDLRFRSTYDEILEACEIAIDDVIEVLKDGATISIANDNYLNVYRKDGIRVVSSDDEPILEEVNLRYKYFDNLTPKQKRIVSLALDQINKIIEDRPMAAILLRDFLIISAQNIKSVIPSIGVQEKINSVSLSKDYEFTSINYEALINEINDVDGRKESSAD